jgi:hypothetical protein
MPNLPITLKSRWRGQSPHGHLLQGITTRGDQMTAELIIFDPDRSTRIHSTDETDRLLSALGQFTSAELLELLYVGQEPGFFELVRGLFALSDESRIGLQNFLATAADGATTGAIDPEGRFILQHKTSD